MSDKHIQSLSVEDWKQATDEQHLQGLFQLSTKTLVSPLWMAYLESERPHVITSYLQIWQANGGHISARAKQRLRKS